MYEDFLTVAIMIASSTSVTCDWQASMTLQFSSHWPIRVRKFASAVIASGVWVRRASKWRMALQTLITSAAIWFSVCKWWEKKFCLNEVTVTHKALNIRRQQIDYLVYGFFDKKCHTGEGFSVIIFFLVSSMENITDKGIHVSVNIIYLYIKFNYLWWMTKFYFLNC